MRRRPRVCATTAKLKAHGQGSDVSTAQCGAVQCSAASEQKKRTIRTRKRNENKKIINKSIISSKKENLLVELGNRKMEDKNAIQIRDGIRRR